jgi:hypothetical protein
LQEPRFERGLDRLEPVDGYSAVDKNAVDLGDDAAPAGSVMSSPSADGTTLTLAPMVVPASRARARPGSEHST